MGTTNPSVKLEVNGEAQVDGGNRFWLSNTSNNAASAIRDIGTTGVSLFSIYNNGSDRLVVKSDGNVGIGTTNPDSRLKVYGGEGGASAYGSLHLDGTTGGILRFQKSGVSVWGLLSGLDVTGGLSFYDYNSGNTGTKFYLGPDGNVGIGTTGPVGQLEVTGNTNWASGWKTGIVSASSDYPTFRLRVTGSGKTSFIGNDNDGGLWFGVNGSDSAYGNYGMVILPGGNVGVVTASPGTKLDISGSLRATSITDTALGAGGVCSDISGNLYIGNCAATANYWSANGTHIYNNNSGNVGIGTTAPGAKLDVVGDINISGTIHSNIAQNNTIGGGQNFSSPSGYWALRTSTNNAYNLDVYNSASPITAMTVLQNGNVGIGTNNPVDKLNVVDTNGGFFFDGSGASYNRFKSTTAVAATGRDLLFSAQDSGTTPDLYIKSTGNVGIGTTGPDAPLEITRNQARTSMTGTAFGTLHIDGGETSSYISSITLAQYNNIPISIIGTKTDTSLGTTMFFGTSNSYSSGITNTALAIKYDGNVGIGTTAPGVKLDVSGTTRSTGFNDSVFSSAGVVMNTSGGDFYTTPVATLLSASSGWTVSGTTVYKTDTTGNVGIGTTNPVYPFVVDKASAGTVVSYLNNSSATGYGLLVSTAANDATRYALQAIGGGGGLTVLSNGNVGIGTTGPGYKLDITAGTSGSKLFRATCSGCASIFGYADSSGSGISNSDPYTSGALVYMNGTKTDFYSGSTDTMTVSGGNVGIGTTGPGAKLDISTTNLMLARFSGNATGDSYIQVQSGTKFLNIGYNSNIGSFLNGSDSMSFYTNGGTIIPLFLSSAGNVGIGNITPGVKLDVSGTTRSTGFNDSAFSSAGVVMNTSGGDFYTTPVATLLSASSGWTVSGTTVYKTDTSGNVGIGVTNPTQKLDVAGAINSNTGLYINPHDNTDTVDVRGASSGEYFRIMSGESGFGVADSQWTHTLTFRNLGPANGNRSEIYNNNGYPLILQPTAGNVGIGVTVPYTKLQVLSNVSGTPQNTSVNPIAIASFVNSNVNVAMTFGGLDVAPYTGWIQMRHNLEGNDVFNLALQPIAGNVGIGMTAPVGKLDVAGGDLQVENGQGRFKGWYTNGSGQAAEIGISGTTAYIYNGNRTPAFSEAGDIQIGGAVAGGLVVKQNTGIVGIGTTAPVSPLEVVGNTNWASGWRYGITATSNDFPTFRLRSINSGTISSIGNDNDGGLYFMVNGSSSAYGTTAMVILPGGNVGVKAATPGTILDVSGTTRSTGFNASAFSSAGVVMNTSGGDFYTTPVATLLAGVAASGWTVSGTTVYKTDTSGIVGIGTTNPGGQLSGTKGISIVDGSNAALGLSNGTNNWLNYLSGTTYRIWNNTSNEVMTILLNGNVGINTTAPGAKLDVVGLIRNSAPSQGTLELSGLLPGYGDNIYPTLKTTGTDLYFSTKGFYNAYLESDASGNTMFDLAGSGPSFNKARINTNGTSYFNGGNVGIGTTAPGQKLEVAGDVLFSGASRTLYLGTAGQAWNKIQNLANDSVITTGSQSLSIQNNAGTLALVTVLNNGNVGIGTTAPDLKLSVNSGSTRSGIDIKGSAGAAWTNAFNDLNFDAIDTTFSSGDPMQFTFSHRGDGYFSGNSGHPTLEFYAPKSGGGYWSFGGFKANGDVYWAAANGATGTTGNVGIGTVSPAAKLDVNGPSKFSGVIALTDSTYFLGSPSFGYRFNDHASAYNNFIIYENGNTYTRGNAGIGTTGPVSPLEVVGNTNWASGWKYGITATSNDYPTVRLRSLGSGTVSSIGNDNDGGLYFLVNGSDSVMGTTGMVILPGGNVGIGTSAPANKLQVIGDIGATGFVYNSSDVSLKKNIATITNPIDKIMKLRGVTFNWKKDNTPAVGLIAQEVQTVYPELVTGAEGSKEVAYSNLVAPLIEAVKAQQKEIETLNARIKILETKAKKK